MSVKANNKNMIHESYYWKEPLLESARKFKDVRSYSEIDEESYIKIEKDIFMDFSINQEAD